VVTHWLVMAIGIGFYVSSAFGTTRAYRDLRVPRLGFSPPRSGPQPPRWSWVVGLAGIFLFVLAARRLGATDGDYYAYLGGAVIVGVLSHVAVILVHNSRLPPTRASGAAPPQIR
jgi:hypothetical protein